MDRLLRADLAAGDLDGPVRDHLVGVHVRLCAAASLEDNQREMVVELPGDHLVGRLDDELDAIGRKLPELAVGQRCRFLEDAERLLHRPPPLETVDADLEIVAGAFRLGAPVTIGGDLHGPHAVGLGARRRGGGHGADPEGREWTASARGPPLGGFFFPHRAPGFNRGPGLARKPISAAGCGGRETGMGRRPSPGSASTGRAVRRARSPASRRY